MKQLDRYLLRQLIGPFLFFIMIFGGILWLNQALRIVDIIVSNKQSGVVLAELSFYLLPKTLETVVPVAAFSAAVFLTNRLYSEAELVVFMGVGHGPANITVAFFAFGGICFAIMIAMTHWITPMALGKLQDRKYEMSQEYLTQFVTAGVFTSPEAGVTVFLGQVSPNGVLSDVIINDARDPLSWPRGAGCEDREPHPGNGCLYRGVRGAGLADLWGRAAWRAGGGIHTYR